MKSGFVSLAKSGGKFNELSSFLKSHDFSFLFFFFFFLQFLHLQTPHYQKNANIVDNRYSMRFCQK